MPNFAHFFHKSQENCSLRSRVMTSSFNSSRANRRTSLRNAACSSLHAKSKVAFSCVDLAQVARGFVTQKLKRGNVRLLSVLLQQPLAARVWLALSSPELPPVRSSSRNAADGHRAT